MNQVGKGMAMLRAINGRIVARNVGSGLMRAMEIRASAVACIAREDEELERGNRARHQLE